VTIFTTNIVTIFTHHFENVVTNSFSTHSFVTIQTISLTNAGPFAPAGTVVLKTTSKTFLTNTISGDFFILPAGLCSVQILSNILTTVIPVTNTITATNAAGGTTAN